MTRWLEGQHTIIPFSSVAYFLDSQIGKDMTIIIDFSFVTLEMLLFFNGQIYHDEVAVETILINQCSDWFENSYLNRKLTVL